MRRVCLFDTSVLVPYYLADATKFPIVTTRMRTLVESVRSGASEHFFYVPNFCIAETFSTFMKYAFSKWNPQLKGPLLDKRIHKSLRSQFQADIHNAKLFYHYELSRYHVLAINLVAPIDHHFKMTRKRSKKTRPVAPAGTFDQLIVSMALHLVKIHGDDEVALVTADDRLARLINKCRKPLTATVKKKLGVDDAETLTGVSFSPSSFPIPLNLKTAKDDELAAFFGEWPIQSAKRYRKPYLV